MVLICKVCSLFVNKVLSALRDQDILMNNTFSEYRFQKSRIPCICGKHKAWPFHGFQVQEAEIRISYTRHSISETSCNKKRVRLEA